MPIHEDRERATSFGADAERYDRTRPSYPASLVDRLTDNGPGRAVDVGCGTGQLGRLLQSRGWEIVGVEADPQMAAVANGHGLPVEVAKFEDWEAGTRRFDLLTSAQAWHWIDPDVGLRKAADVVRSGGRVALIWIGYAYDEPVGQAITDTFTRHAPGLVADSVVLGTVSDDHERLDLERFEREGARFAPPEILAFEHARNLTIDHWIAELPTHSQIATMEEAPRRALTDALRAALERVAPDGIAIRQPVRMTTAVRR